MDLSSLESSINITQRNEGQKESILWEHKNLEFHSRFEPDCSSIVTAREMRLLFGSPKGGIIDQATLYCDQLGAADWCRLANQEDYVMAFDHLPLSFAAELIIHELKKTPYYQHTLDVVGLGCGDGKKEAALLRHLLKQPSIEKLRCYLFESSVPLMIEAHQYLASLFPDSRQVQLRESFGNFMHLPRYPVFHEPEEPNTLRVVCMFGGTIGNLASEMDFICHSLHPALKPGDLFLVDCVLGFAPCDQPDAIREQDPRMQGKWQSTTQDWLEGTLRRYRTNVKEVEFQNALKMNSSPIPNTYTIEMQAKLDDQCKFTMLKLHRYNMDSFVNTIAQAGFRKCSGRRYGINQGRLLYLFVRE